MFGNETYGCSVHPIYIVTDLFNVLPGNSFVKTNNGNNRRKIVFLCGPRRAGGDLGSLLPGNAAVNMHPQQCETEFSVGSVQRSYLKDERRYEFSSEFPTEDSHERFVCVIRMLHSYAILGMCDSVRLL
jgi:hypothetical protein